jgi:hypothetical protein
MDYRKQALNRQYNVKKKVNLSEIQETSWEKYFDSTEILDNGICVFKSGSSGTPVILVHGAGMTSLSWAIVGV